MAEPRGVDQGSSAESSRSSPIDSTTFGIVDIGDRTLTYWSWTGEYRGAMELPALPEGGRPTVLPRATGGHYVAFPGTLFNGPVSDAVQRSSGPVIAWDGTVIDTIARMQGAEWFRYGDAMGSPAYRAEGFADGMGSGVWLGDTRHPQVEFWTDTGQSHLVRWEAASVPMSDARLTAYIDDLIAQTPGELLPDEETAVRRLMAGLPRVTNLPAWNAMWVGREREVWISPAHGRWVVLDSDGLPIGETTVPPGFLPFDNSGDQVIGLHTDDLGVQSVRAYRLFRNQPTTFPDD